MTFRIANPLEMPTHFAMRQFDSEQAAWPLLMLFRVSSMHGIQQIPTDEEAAEILGLLMELPANKFHPLVFESP